MIDYKYEVSLKADELAQEKYNKDFYDLSDDIQLEVYNEAMEDYDNDLICQAENYRDMLRGN